MKKVKVRRLRMDDYEAVKQIQLKSFTGMKPWTRVQFYNLVTIFPEGQMCVEYEGAIAASSCSHIINYDVNTENLTWAELTHNGMITNHDPNGDTLYGIEIMVDPAFRGMKLSRRLYEARKKLVRERHLKRIVIGGRIPGYCEYAGKMSAAQYVQKVIDRKIYDPVLTAQIANGFVLKRLLPGYLPNDKESCGFATFLEWTNYNYKTAGRERRRPQYVRACAVQYQMRAIKSFDEFAHHCRFFVDAASDYRCDFILFPEMFTMPLLTFLPDKKPGEAVRQLSQFTGRIEDLFTELAIQFNINIIAGSHFNVENDNLYNVSYLFRRDGSMEKQYKIHITPYEKKWWGVKPGNKINVFDTDMGKIAIIICYDVEFPELARIAANKGAEIFFVPYNTDERRAYLRVRYCAQARAIENQVYVVMAGCVGNLPDADNVDIQYSQAAILTPSDVEFHREAIANEASANTETMIFQDLDLNLLTRNRQFGNALTWEDRRTDLYKIKYTDGNKTISF